MSRPVIRERSISGLYVREVKPAERLHAASILFLHGSWHGAFCWEGWQERFAGMGWASAALSYCNHDRSYSLDDAAFCRLTVFDYVADCRTTVEGLGLRNPVVVGHSMGGVVGQKLAEALCREGAPPSAFVGLASVSPEGVGAIRERPLPEDRPIRLDPADARRLLFSQIDDERFAAFMARLGPESPSVQNWTGGGRTPVDPAAISCPMLFVGAGADACGIHPAARLAAFYGADWLEIPGAGHDLMLEPCEGALAALVNAWLVSRLGAGGMPPPVRAQPPR